jgi:stage V sporulation protein B
MSSIIKASLWLTLSELFFNLSGYVTHSILGRTLGPAEYGRYGLIITIATMMVVLIGRGVPIAMSKYLSEVWKTDPAQVNHIKKVGATVQFFIIVLTTALYYFLAPVFANLLNDPSLTPLFRLSSFIIPTFALASFYVYYFTGTQQFNIQSVLKFFRGFSKIFFIAILALFFSTKGAIIGHALAPLSVFLLAFGIDWRRHKKINNLHTKEKNRKTKLPKLKARSLLNFAWPITLFMLFYEIMIHIDLYMVKGILQNDTLTGFYNASLTVGRLPYYAFYFLTIILLPKISESTANNTTEETKKIMTSAMRFLFMLIIPAVTLLAVFTPSALDFFYGGDYAPATDALRVLSVGLGFLTVFYILAFVLNGAGKNKIPMWTAFVGLIINTVLSFYFISFFGIMGAALATTITSFLIMLVAIITTEKYVSSFLTFIPILKYFIATAVIGIIANYLPQGKFIFIFWSILLLITYFVILYLLKEIKATDLKILESALKKK